MVCYELPERDAPEWAGLQCIITTSIYVSRSLLPMKGFHCIGCPAGVLKFFLGVYSISQGAGSGGCFCRTNDLFDNSHSLCSLYAKYKIPKFERYVK